MNLTVLTQKMVDLVRETVTGYQTDVAYDVAILAEAANGSEFAWLLRKHGTCIADFSDRTFAEAVAPYYATWDILKAYTIKKHYNNTYIIEEVA